MMKKLYNQSELYFSFLWIIVYCFFMSLGDSISADMNMTSIMTLPIAFIMCIVLFQFIKNNGLLEKYGLIQPKIRAQKMLYYLPLVLMMGVNLIYGFDIYTSLIEAVVYVLTMLCVGFLEEVIFRGLLFHAMKKDNLKWAIIVSSLTFGMGHILNLFNGNSNLLPSLLQVLYATAAGFMFVMIYLKSNSLIPCIIAHGVFNALSVFTPANIGYKTQIISALFLIVVCGSYALQLYMMKNTDFKK